MDQAALAADGADFGDCGDIGETADLAETGETADFADTGDTADFADTGDTADFADTGETADFAETADTADWADNAVFVEASAVAATRSTEARDCCEVLGCTCTVSVTGTAGWATATPAPIATTPSAPVIDQNIDDFFMVSKPSRLLLLLLNYYKHDQ